MDYLRKEMLFWVPFVVDLLLCLIQFPMFALKGPEWMMNTLSGGNSKEKMTSTFAQLYDTFLLCYTGYCAMMFYGLFSIINHPELMPGFGAIMFGVILVKEVVLKRWEIRGGAKELRKAKQGSLNIFYVPCYGGYCLLCFLEWWNSGKE